MSNNLGVQTGSFTDQTANAIAGSIAAAGIIGTSGNVYYCDSVNGNDAQNGQAGQNVSPGVGPVQSLAAGYGLLAEGHNDVLVLIGNGLSSGSARIHSAFTWSKDAAHLVGICSPSLVSQRARIAPGTTDTAFANFFTVSGNGCFFSNLEFFQGFATAIAAEICMTVTGSRNVFSNVHIAGMGDTGSTAGALSTTSRNLVISGSGGENLFTGCTIGLDTVVRAANYSVEFKAGTPRNVFRNCIFPSSVNSASAACFYTAGAATIDRFTLIEDCYFLNAVNSGGTAMTYLATLAASSGGMLVFTGRTACVGYTDVANATSGPQCWVSGPAPAAGACVAVEPTT